MEEYKDIKILEKLCVGCKIWEEDLQAIENLIAKNQELEKEIEKRKWVKIKENGEIEPLFYIPKSKVKEKIEELEAMSISKDIYYDDIKRLFQELLEDFSETGDHIPGID